MLPVSSPKLISEYSISLIPTWIFSLCGALCGVGLLLSGCLSMLLLVLFDCLWHCALQRKIGSATHMSKTRTRTHTANSPSHTKHNRLRFISTLCPPQSLFCRSSHLLLWSSFSFPPLPRPCLLPQPTAEESVLGHSLAFAAGVLLVFKQRSSVSQHSLFGDVPQ